MQRTRLYVLAVLLVGPAWADLVSGQEARGAPPPDDWPPWTWCATKEETAQLRDIGRSREGAIFLIGQAHEGKFGTAFCVCTEHRLLATNAHVVDPAVTRTQLSAVHATTGWLYRVERVWIHPGIARRGVNGEVLTANDGPNEIHAQSADVALLQLSGDGPEPPVAFPLAPSMGGDSLRACAVGYVGYPTYAKLHALRPHEVPPSPAVSTGVFHGATSLVGGTAGDYPTGYVWHTALAWPGASGGPLFLVDGRVAAVQNSSGTTVADGRPYVTFGGIAVSVLWDLLSSAEGLEACHLARPGNIPVTLLHGRRGPAEAYGVDPSVVSALARARHLMAERKWREACDVLNDAIRREPTQGTLYQWRAHVLRQYCDEYFPVGSAGENRQKYLRWAIEDARRALECEPYLPQRHAEFGYPLCQAAWEVGDTAALESLGGVANHYLRGNNPPAAQAHFFALRACVLGSLRRPGDAIADLDRAMAIEPQTAAFFSLRGAVYEALGEVERGRADRVRAQQLTAREGG